MLAFRAEWQRKSWDWDWPIKDKNYYGQKDRDIGHWKKVLWTVESRFEAFGSPRRIFVRRRTTEKMLEECLTPSVKQGRGNVMVWACFGAGKGGDLFRVKGILNMQGYHSTLQCHAIYCGQRLILANFIPSTGQWPKEHLQIVQELFRKEAGLKKQSLKKKK